MGFNDKTNKKNQREEAVGQKKQTGNAAINQVRDDMKNKVRDIHNNK
jgi:hypothetical protein